MKSRTYIAQKVRETHQRKKIYISAFKTEKGCAICKEKDSIVLDLHHKEGTEKNIKLKFGIRKSQNRTFDYLSWEEIDIELDKCDVLCANCHRRVHRKLETT